MGRRLNRRQFIRGAAGGVTAAASFQPQTITHILEIRPAVRRPGRPPGLVAPSRSSSGGKFSTRTLPNGRADRKFRGNSRLATVTTLVHLLTRITPWLYISL